MADNLLRMRPMIRSCWNRSGGSFSYAILVTSGRYVLTPYFAARQSYPGELLNCETKDQRERSGMSSPVVFNGKVLLQNFDLTKKHTEWMS